MAMAPLRVLPATALLCTFTASLAAQDWLQIATTAFTPVRNGACATYDLTRQEMVMFGGASTGAASGGLQDTWTWNGTTWTLKNPATVPPTRQLGAMDYDLTRGVVVMFGGRIHGGPIAPPAGVQNDLWEWDGTNWTQVNATNPPAPRYSPNLVFDVARNKHVMWGGVSASNIGFNETWEYDATTQSWAQIATATSPGSRVYAGMAYDLARNRTVLYGGRDDNYQPVAPLFWEYDGSNWTSVSPATVPGDMHSHVMVYDQIRQRIVMQGGRGATFHSGTWEYDGVHCYRFDVEANPAYGNQAAAGAYDLLRNRVVVCGGYNASLQRNADTWERDADKPAYALFGAGCTGSGGVPALSAGSLPALGTTFSVGVSNLPPSSILAWFTVGFSNQSWMSVPLPLDLGVLGFPGCKGLVSPDFTTLQPVVAGNSSWVVSVPNNPALAGLTFYNQAIGLETSGGLVFSNGGQAHVY